MLVVLGLVSVSALVASVPHAAAEDFVPGAASARADTLKVAAQVGGIDVGLSIGRSVASYRGSFAAGEGRALDLEALPFLIGETTACEGVTPLLPDAALPEKTLIESTQDGSKGSHRTQTYFPEVKGGPSTTPAGWQETRVPRISRGPTRRPRIRRSGWGCSRCTIPPPRSRRSWWMRVREAKATMTADQISILNGLITLNNVRFEAVARSGAEDVTEGSFTVESGRLFGLYRTPEQSKADLAQFGKLFSDALGILGAAVDLPEVVIDGPRVEVTPLVFRFTDMPLGKQLIGPLLDVFSDSVDKFYSDLQASGCEGQSNVQLLQLAEDLLRGNGSIVIPIGGVLVSTDDTYVEPFDLGAPLEVDDAAPDTPQVLQEPSTSGDSSSEGSFDGLDLDYDSSLDLGVDFSADLTDTGFADTGIASEVAGSTEESAAAEDGSTEESAAAEDGSVAEVGSKTIAGKSGGLMTLLGVLAMLAAVALGFGDRMTMVRDRRRVIEDE